MKYCEQRKHRNFPLLFWPISVLISGLVKAIQNLGIRYFEQLLGKIRTFNHLLMKQALKYPTWGTFLQYKKFGAQRWHAVFYSDEALLSQYEACIRTNQQLNLHLEVDGICRISLLGQLKVRVGAFFTPSLKNVLFSTAAQHRASGQDVGTMPWLEVGVYFVKEKGSSPLPEMRQGSLGRRTYYRDPVASPQ